MPEFIYKARHKSGQLKTGSIVALSRGDVLREIASQALVALSIEEIQNGVAGFSIPFLVNRVPVSVLVASFEQLSQLLSAGVPLLRAINTVKTHTSNSRMCEILMYVSERVSQGGTLANAIGEFPEVFDELIVSLVHAGEEGGFMEESLSRVTRLMERQEDLRGRVKGAMTYPIFLLIVGSVVVTGMITVFVPKFAPLFERMKVKGELPIPTQLLLGLSHSIQQYWMPMVVALAILVAVALRSRRQPGVRRWCDRVKLNLVVIGPILRTVAISRFCRVLGTLLKNGVSILSSLRIATNATGNVVLTDALQKASDQVSSGRSLVSPLRASGEFPSDLLEMIAVGESANRLDTMLIEMADRLDVTAQRRIDGMVKLLEPMMMLVMAVMVGFLVMALLLPVLTSQGL